MKQKKNVRAAKSVPQQIEDLKRAIAKYGDHDGKRRHQLAILQLRQGYIDKELLQQEKP